MTDEEQAHGSPVLGCGVSCHPTSPGAGGAWHAGRMSRRELVVLGTASMVPTRTRNHNGYVLLWDDEAILFDPGEGTQRQMTFAGVSATDLTRIAITHLHGDHSLGLAGVSQRISGDGVRHPIGVTYPASGQRWVNHLLDASAHHRRGHLELQPLTTDGVVRPSPAAPSRASRSAPSASTTRSRPWATVSTSPTAGRSTLRSSPATGSRGRSWASCSARAASRRPTAGPSPSTT